MLPSAEELEYFIEVAHSLNLSRASERLGISQPSLSLAMKRLENTINTPLFIRHKHGVSLTPAGKQLLLHARTLLQTWENTKFKALASQEQIQGHFTLGCNSIIANYMLSDFLPDLLEQYPRLELHLKHDISQKITGQVISLNIDIGIVINPVKHPDLIIRKLGIDKTRFWVGVGNRKIQDIYSEHAAVICNPNMIQTQHLLTRIKKIGIVFKRTISTESIALVAKLTAYGSGVGILPTRAARSLYSNELKPILKLPSCSDELCLIYRNENRNIKAIQVITKAIKDASNKQDFMLVL